jgi:DNA-binding XRE family transcriptional regulator
MKINETPEKLRLRTLMAQNDLSELELANLLGISRQYMCNLVNSKYKPSITLMIKMTKIFNISLEEILSIFYKI